MNFFNNISKKKKEILEKEKLKKEESSKKMINNYLEATEHIFTFSLNNYLSKTKKTIDDYIPVFISSASSELLSPNYSKIHAISNLYDKMKEEGIEAVVDLRISTSVSGLSSMVNPSEHHTLVYGTGLKPK